MREITNEQVQQLHRIVDLILNNNAERDTTLEIKADEHGLESIILVKFKIENGKCVEIDRRRGYYRWGETFDVNDIEMELQTMANAKEYAIRHEAKTREMEAAQAEAREVA